MNLSDYERLANRVVDAEPGSVTESSQVEQLVAACQGGRTLAVMDALFRHAARGLTARLPAGWDLHESVMLLALDNEDARALSGPETKVLTVLASYACGDPDHAYDALANFYNSARTTPEAQVNLAALIRVAKSVHAGRILMKEEQ